jgi:hypothetical protein
MLKVVQGILKVGIGLWQGILQTALDLRQTALPLWLRCFEGLTRLYKLEELMSPGWRECYAPRVFRLTTSFTDVRMVLSAFSVLSVAMLGKYVVKPQRC